MSRGRNQRCVSRTTDLALERFGFRKQALCCSPFSPPSLAMAAESPPLTLQMKIPLGEVRGRIDHLAIDHARQRLFVAEFDNNSLAVVDLKDHKILHRVAGLREPQGVAMSQLLIVFSSVTGAMDRSVFSGEATFRPLRGWNSRPMPTLANVCFLG